VFRPEDFTEDGTLRVGWLLWAAMVFSNRHLILLVLGAVTSFVGARIGLDARTLGVMYSSAWFLLAGVPALGVLAAALRRSTGAGALVRWLWHRGRWLLSLSAALDLLLLLCYPWWGRGSFNELHVLGGVMDVYLLAYLLRSGRARARFDDFPPPRRSTRS
jgi:hypothetical protein